MKRLACLALLLLCSASLHASARLTYQIQGNTTPLAWSSSAFPITYEIDNSAVSRLPDAQTAISDAFTAWTNDPDSIVSFRYGGVAASPAGHDGHNSVSVSDGLFASSGFIAYTTTWFDDNGTIQEADIQVDPSAASGHNVRALVEHEVGHLLGLDHSAVVSAVMYPFVNEDAMNALDSDDLTAIASIYPANGFQSRTATLAGQVTGNGGAVFGAQVVAINSDGRLVASALTDSNGQYRIDGVPLGSYQMYVEPLDGPVDPQNLSGVWRDSTGSEFPTGFLVTPRSVEVTGGSDVQNLDFQEAGPATLNPKWIGTFPAGSTDVKLGSTVELIQPGSSVSIALGGDGIIGGMTQFKVLSQGITRTSDFQYGPNYVWATFSIGNDLKPGSLVILANNGNERATLTGGLRIAGDEPRRRAVR